MNVGVLDLDAPSIKESLRTAFPTSEKPVLIVASRVMSRAYTSRLLVAVGVTMHV